MKISRDGLALIKQFEGCRLEAYRCAAGVLTIGYGSTGAHVKEGMKITQAEADQLLSLDLVRFERAVMSLANKPSQQQFDALVSFAFNLGEGALRSSTLMKLHNQGLFIDASNQFTRWNKAAGRVLLGLTRRREAEKKLYLS